MEFKRVSYTAFADDIRKHYSETMKPEKMFDAWNGIKLPERGTEYSAGYDICTPIDITIPPKCRVVVPTGIKAVFSPDEMKAWHLQMYVRSSVGIKDGIVLTNGTGVIDPDYQYGKNDGDMMLALLNTGDNLVQYKAGDRICQAVFCIHGVICNDVATGERKGGIGSTGK